MSRTRIPLDTYDWRPPELKQYLRNFGFHFNKKLAEFAISKMRKLNPTTNRLEKIEAVSKDKIDELMKKYGIVLKYNELYDYVYVYHMALSDYFKSSLPTEESICKFCRIMWMTPTKRTASFLIVGMPIAVMRVFQSNGMICYDTPAIPTRPG